MVIQDALYNVVRPQKFSEVVGQTNTIKAIKTALTKGVLEHSLIFYGQTGGGKTTTARIVAKWLQCDSKVDNEPCCQCETCKAIKAETFADYVELNASTNGGKDDIDRLLENISFAPQYGKCKVYVIDEAHCLTDGAWKSLLKPLEEPPSHVYFILCTTDFQSIPQTIKNRCGKYEFSRITKADILGLLGDLRIKYKAAYTDEALGLLAESADGSLRNAVNNFSHISMPFGEGEEIGEDSVKKYLALVGPETMAEYVGALVKKDLGRALSIIHEEEESAVNPDNFLKMILNAISDALTVSCNAALNREVSEEYMKTLKEISSYGMIRLSGVAGKLNEQYSKLTCRNYSSLRITSAEICMLSTGSGDSELINELLARIADLEQRGCAALPHEQESQCQGFAKESMQAERREEIPNIANTGQADNEESLEQPFDFVGAEDSYDEENPFLNEPDMEESIVSDYDAVPRKDIPKEMPVSDSESETELSFFDSFFNSEEPAEEDDEKGTEKENDGVAEAAVEKTQDFGGYANGIIFDDANVAKAYEKSKDTSVKTAKALKAACEEFPLLSQLCNECCTCDKAGDGIALATPFGPVAQVIKVLLEYASVRNVSVFPVDGVKIGAENV
jgi:DNA polymerase III subunit gamma/tau